MKNSHMLDFVYILAPYVVNFENIFLITGNDFERLLFCYEKKVEFSPF